jgi:hypothetical protein
MGSKDGAYMKRLWILIVLVAVFVPVGGFAKPKMTVQLVADFVNVQGLRQNIFIVLPDGSHATAECWTMHPDCGIDSFTPEKRIKKPCVSKDRSFQANCYASESYYATRKVNDITIYAANGARVYHITGSWDSFEDGTVLPKPLAGR